MERGRLSAGLAILNQGLRSQLTQRRTPIVALSYASHLPRPAFSGFGTMSKPEGLPPMEYRFLGRSGLQVSAIALGGWLTSGGHVNPESTFAGMKAAYDCGVNFFDCAESYADGESERVMGDAIRKFGWKRNDLVISTKVSLPARRL